MNHYHDPVRQSAPSAIITIPLITKRNKMILRSIALLFALACSLSHADLAGTKWILEADSLGAVGFDGGTPEPSPKLSYSYRLQNYYDNLVLVDMSTGGRRMSRSNDFGYIQTAAVDARLMLHSKWITDGRLEGEIFALGFNDWLEPPIGGVAQFKAQFLERVMRDYNTFPQGGGEVAKFIIISPIYNLDDELLIKPENSLGETLDDYRDACFDVADYMADFADVLFIDGKLITMTAADFATDGIHINQNGHEDVFLAITSAITSASFPFP